MKLTTFFIPLGQKKGKCYSFVFKPPCISKRIKETYMMTKEETERVRLLGAYHELENVIVDAITTKRWRNPKYFGNNCIRAMKAYETKNALLELAKSMKGEFDVPDFMKTQKAIHIQKLTPKVLDTDENRFMFSRYKKVLASQFRKEKLLRLAKGDKPHVSGGGDAVVDPLVAK